MGSTFDSTYLECRRHSLNGTNIHFKHTMRDGPMYVLHSTASAGSPEFVDPRGTVSQGRFPALSYGFTHTHMPGADPWRIDAFKFNLHR